MRNFLLKARNLGAYLLVAFVVFTFAYNVFMLIKASVSEPFLVVYTASKSVFYINLCMAAIAVTACWLYKTNSDERKADFFAFCGSCGVFSFLFFGLVVLVAGFCAGCFWAPLGIFALSLYVGIGVFCLTAHFTHKVRNPKEETDSMKLKNNNAELSIN